jgi:thiol-disulfide isomerase/thioredoxin
MYRLLPLLFILFSAQAIRGENLLITDSKEREIEVAVLPASGDLLVIWLTDHEQHRTMFEEMLLAVQASGIEVWRVDLLRDYFLTRSNEQVRTLDGAGITALINAAHQQSNKRILLAAYDRMPLPLLRGLREWQDSRADESSRVSGAVLFYPNLFGPAPAAGVAPSIDPIVRATNYPITLVQPERGSHRWRIGQVLEQFWQTGAPAFGIIEPNVRDWYFMHEPGEDPAERVATDRVPGLLQEAAGLMDAAPKPLHPLPLNSDNTSSASIQGLIRLPTARVSPELKLTGLDEKVVQLSDYSGKVVLLSFWATWCPPCVEEIPTMNHLASRYQDQDFAILSVDFQESEQTIREFTGRVPVDFPILLDKDGRTSLEWQVFSFPSSFLLDRHGRIRYSVNRAIDWDSAEVQGIIDELLAETDN